MTILASENGSIIGIINPAERVGTTTNGSAIDLGKFHQAMFAKDFKQLGGYLADTAVFWMEDGTTINGKDSMMKFVEANFSKINIKN